MSHPVRDETEPKRSVNRATVRRVVDLFRPYRARVGLTLIAVIVGVLMGLLPPYFLRIIIDDGLLRNDLRTVSIFSALTVIVTIAAAGVTLLYGYWSVLIGQYIMCDIRNNLFVRLQAMSLRFFTATRTGEIQTRLISDVQGVQTVVSTTVTDALSNVAIVITSLVAMFLLDWRLTLLSVGMVPLFAVIGSKVGDFAKNVRRGTQEQTAELNSMMQETLSVSGVLLTKTTGRLDTLTRKFDQENRKLAGWQIKMTLVNYLFFAMIRLITSLAPALVYWLAGYLMWRGDASITVGVLVAFTALQTRMFFPLTGLLNIQVEILSSFALFERIFEYLDLQPDVQESPNAVALPKESVLGRIEFRDVCFSYDESVRSHAVVDISFTAEPGQLVALVGPSGAGKTTLTYFIPRLYDPDSGQVLLDGHDVRDIRLQDLAEIVGAVTQETYLLHSTIRENLHVAKPDATDEEMVEACRLAAIHDHITSLPEGYDTVVGERGYRFSGGEKQRLAIARALLKNPRVLILDEATSALDTRSERLIQASLAGLMKGRTTFAIAHRLSTILAADQILVMDQGRIVERGTHETLLARGGLYRRLYEEQFAQPTTVRVSDEDGNAD
ncbi:MAG: ABC transporter ATP-binding protein [Fimbriimonadia bacterium]